MLYFEASRRVPDYPFRLCENFERGQINLFVPSFFVLAHHVTYAYKKVILAASAQPHWNLYRLLYFTDAGLEFSFTL